MIKNFSSPKMRNRQFVFEPKSEYQRAVKRGEHTIVLASKKIEKFDIGGHAKNRTWDWDLSDPCFTTELHALQDYIYVSINCHHYLSFD